MGILHIIRIMRFQMDFQIFVGFVVNTTDAAFEIFVAFMGAHMAINQKARREILPTDLAIYSSFRLHFLWGFTNFMFTPMFENIFALFRSKMARLLSRSIKLLAFIYDFLLWMYLFPMCQIT